MARMAIQTDSTACMVLTAMVPTSCLCLFGSTGDAHLLKTRPKKEPLPASVLLADMFKRLLQSTAVSKNDSSPYMVLTAVTQTDVYANVVLAALSETRVSSVFRVDGYVANTSLLTWC